MNWLGFEGRGVKVKVTARSEIWGVIAAGGAEASTSKYQTVYHIAVIIVYLYTAHLTKTHKAPSLSKRKTYAVVRAYTTDAKQTLKING